MTTQLEDIYYFSVRNVLLHLDELDGKKKSHLHQYCQVQMKHTQESGKMHYLSSVSLDITILVLAQGNDASASRNSDKDKGPGPGSQILNLSPFFLSTFLVVLVTNPVYVGHAILNKIELIFC